MNSASPGTSGGLTADQSEQLRDTGPIGCMQDAHPIVDHAAKRPRTGTEDYYEDTTSNYSISGMENIEEGGTPFTFVSYKKDRPSGIPILIKPTNPGSSFWRVNPNAIASEILAVSQEKLIGHRFTEDGSLAVNVASLASANKLLAITTLVGVTCTATVPKSYSRNIGKITGVPLEYTEEELLEFLKDFGVLSLRRQASYYRREDDDSTDTIYHDSVILHFRPDKPLPTRVMLGFTSHPVQEYFGTAVQCFGCQKHGHIAKYCRGPQRCKVCAGSHHHKECGLKQSPLCANCAGPHAASYGGCPSKKTASLSRKQELQEGRPQKRRSPPPNPKMIRTTPVPSLQDPLHFPHIQGAKGTYSTVLTSNPLKSQKRQKTQAPDAQETRPKQTVTSPIPAPRRKRASRNDGGTTTRNIQSENDSLEKIILPLVFAALKAILRSFPDIRNVQEVQTLLTMEPLITLASRGFQTQPYE